MIHYTEKQIRFLRTHRRLPRRELAALYNRRWRTSWSFEQIDSLCGRKKIFTGRTGRFKKGHIPWNNGTKGMGICKPNSGCFKTGSIPPNHKPVDSKRIDVDGYIYIKTAEPNIWRMKHIIVWEKRHGAIPAGRILRFKDGNTLNCRIGNLELISRSLHCRLNKLRYNNAPAKTRPTLKLIAQIQARCSELKRN